MVQGLQVYHTMLEELIVMQLVGSQVGPGSTVTVNELVAVLPQTSTAVTRTVVLEFFGKQVVTGGLKVSVTPPLAQQRSVAVALNGTGVQGLQV
jgi:hypothetical protein